jgi:two-component system, LytTR family, sensor kinase
VNSHNKRYRLFAKAEFWVSSTITFFALISLIGEVSSDAAMGDLGSENAGDRLVHYYLMEVMQILGLYASYLFLNFKVVPSLIKREKIVLNTGFIGATCICLGLLFGSLDTGFAALVMLAVYSLVKYSILYFWNNAGLIQQRFRFLAPGVLLAVPLWIISIIFLAVAEAHYGAIIAWSVIIWAGILMYSYSFLVLIPRAQTKKHPGRNFFLTFSGIIIVSELFLSIVASILEVHADLPLVILIINFFYQLLFIAPLSWIVYRRTMKSDERISSLEKELGQSSANLDFLRSQINPHFLFNALNTLYGTALQENANRTSEGIQKLGDMMRFMLQENMQDKISLTREVEYLNNYIQLQKLRTDLSPSVVISSAIQESVQMFSIAPMLLIPFVENAFKHGISFREPSYIKISLYVKDNVLLFDVSNSIHPKHGNDPEKDKSGIGLMNVKQRLELLYKNRHELIVRESAKEFFVHLTIHLS